MGGWVDINRSLLLIEAPLASGGCIVRIATLLATLVATPANKIALVATAAVGHRSLRPLETIFSCFCFVFVSHSKRVDPL